MAFTYTNISAYTDEHSFELISQAVLGSTLIDKYCTKVPGLSSGTTKINLLNSLIYPKAATAGWTASGSVNFEQVSLVTVDKEVKESFDVEALRGYWLSTQLSPSGQLEEIPFGQKIAELKVKQISKYIEEICWAGDGGSLEGLNSYISVASGSSTIASASNWTTTALANSETVKMIAAIPATVQDAEDLTCYVSRANYNMYNQYLVGANLFHYIAGAGTGTTVGDQYVIIPGTNVKMVPMSGQTNANRVVIGPASDLQASVGLTGDYEKIDIFYDKSTDTVKLMAKFRIGIRPAHAAYWVTNAL